MLVTFLFFVDQIQYVDAVNAVDVCRRLRARPSQALCSSQTTAQVANTDAVKSHGTLSISFVRTSAS